MTYFIEGRMGVGTNRPFDFIHHVTRGVNETFRRLCHGACLSSNC